MAGHRPTWAQAFRAGIVSGTVASLASTLTMAFCGRLEGTSAAGPLNGPSQWIWGRSAARQRRASVRETATGYVIHHAMSIGWATVHEKYVAAPADAPPHTQLSRGALTAAIAWFVDYHLTPRRLQPGFDEQLSDASLFAVYAAFAIGLAAAARLKPPR